MSKQKKKRNKPYTGADAASKGPVVHKYVAVERSPLGEWWLDHKRAVKLSSLIGGGGALVIWFLYEALRLAF